MKKTLYLTSAVAVMATLMFAQVQQRQAVIRGGGSPNQGKCTIEVLVDDSAEVQIQGNNATLRTTSGQPSQFRRFECTAPMPANPANFRFAGVDGRGRQDLIRDPRNGNGAIVRIEDRDGGSEGYTFDLFWGNWDQSVFQRPQGSVPQLTNPGPGGYRDYGDDRYRPGYRDSEYYRRYGHGFAVDDAIYDCRQDISRQAAQRFRGADIHIRRTDIADSAGSNDWVTGSLDIHRGFRREVYNFSCSVNFDNGRMRWARIDAQSARY